MSNHGIVVHAAGDLRVDQVEAPQAGDDEAIIEVAYGGVCGSDIHYWRHGSAGPSILREPMILGHEASGTVLIAARDGSGPTAGTPVAIHPLTSHGDGATPWPTDRPNLAPASTYLGSAMHLPHTQGVFAQRVALPARMLHPVPDGMPLQLAALAEPAAVAWHGIERAGEVRGKRIAVIGAGPIGQLVASVAQHHEADSVFVSDVFPLPLEIARSRGITGLDARDQDAIAQLHADVVVESSGTVPGLSAAISATRRGGTVVLLGLQNAGDVPAAMATVTSRELDLKGSFRFAGGFDDVLAALADGSLAVTGIITHVRPYARAVEAFELASDASRSSKVLLDFGGEA